ncbi:MAG: efflux RND transporter periplasmic adaptor subunit [Tepidisphaerales bacterium]
MSYNPEPTQAAPSPGSPSQPVEAAPAMTPEGPHGKHAHVPTSYSPWTKVGVALFVLALAAGLSITYVRGRQSRHDAEAVLAEEAQRAAAEPATVDIVHVLAAPAASTLTLPGEARSFYETTIFARTSGYLSKWLVDIGDKVAEGQTLALIETPELDDQMAAAKAKLQALGSEVHVAETAVTFARVSFERWEAAAPEGAVSGQERDQKKAELDSSVARLDAAKSQVALGEADEQRLTTLMGFKKVVAPFAGVITQRHVDVGDLVTAGSTSNTTSLFTIAQAGQIRVFVDVPQPAIPYIKVGMDVETSAREYPGRKFLGKVDRTAESVDPASRTLKVQVLVPNPDGTLLPGMYVYVSFQKTRSRPPLRVPAAALRFRTAGPQVAAVMPDNTIEFRDVRITRDLGDFVEVEGSLAVNESVALNAGNDIHNGDHVNPRDSEPSAGGDGPMPLPTAAVRDVHQTLETH